MSENGETATKAKPRARAVPSHVELKAMDLCWRSIEPLDAEQQRRVVMWLVAQIGGELVAE